MNVKPIARFVYGFVGTVFLIGGATVMLLHTGRLPETLSNLVMTFAHGDPLAVHLIQEMASIVVFVGLITFWFIGHYEQSKVFHWAMTTFWALFSLAHWFDGSEAPRSVRGLMINTIPFAVFFLIGLLRTSEGRKRR